MPATATGKKPNLALRGEDETAAMLCDPLLRFLESRPTLREGTRYRLAALQIAINAALVGGTPAAPQAVVSSSSSKFGVSRSMKNVGSLLRMKSSFLTSSSSKVVKISPSPKAEVGAPTKSSTDLAGERHDSSPAWISTQKVLGRRREENIFRGKEDEDRNELTSKRADHLSISPANQGQKRRRVLMAVNVYNELSEKESSMTLMEQLLGERFYEWYWSKRRFFAPLGWLVSILFIILSFFTLLLPVTELSGQIASLGSFVCMLIVALQRSSYSNFSMLRRCLRTYEGIVLTSELFFLALSMGTVFCLAPWGILFALTSFLSLWSTLMSYDAAPLTIRKRSRYLYGAGLLTFILFFFAFYLRLLPHMCVYRLDMEQGLVLEHEEVIETEGERGCGDDYVLRRTAGRWSFSMLEFLLSRGYTLIILTLKLFISALKHPQDCVILKSRVRVLEIERPAGHHHPQDVMSRGDEPSSGWKKEEGPLTKQQVVKPEQVVTQRAKDKDDPSRPATLFLAAPAMPLERPCRKGQGGSVDKDISMEELR